MLFVRLSPYSLSIVVEVKSTITLLELLYLLRSAFSLLFYSCSKSLSSPHCGPPGTPADVSYQRVDVARAERKRRGEGHRGLGDASAPQGQPAYSAPPRV